MTELRFKPTQLRCVLFNTDIVPLKFPASFSCAVGARRKDYDSTHFQGSRGAAHPKGQCEVAPGIRVYITGEML